MTEPASLATHVTSEVHSATRSRGPLVNTIWHLARFEGSLLLRHPLNLAGSIASLVAFFLATRDKAPVLDEDVITLAGSCLLLGAAALLAAEAVAGRDDRQLTAELVEVMPTSESRRRIGLVAASWAPLVLTAFVVGLGILWLQLDTPAGSMDWIELAAAPALVVIAHVAGVAIGTHLRFPLAGTAVVLLVGALYGLSQVCIGCGGELPPPSPLLPWHASLTPLPQSANRLPEVHLIYVVGLIALLASVAARHLKSTAFSAVVVLAAGLGLSGVPDSMEALSQRADQWVESVQSTCMTRQSVTYCALPGFEPWVDRWEDIVSGVDRAVPGGIEAELIVQGKGRFGTNEHVMVGTRLGRTGTPDQDGADLAIALAASSLGLPTQLNEVHDLQAGVPECLRQTYIPVFGEARGAGMLVLAGLATTDTLSYIQNRAAAVSAESQEQFGHVLMPGPEIALAGRILNRPANEVIEVLAQHWQPLLDPKTSVLELADWFHESGPIPTEPPPAIDQHQCECTPSGGIRCAGQEP